MSKGTRCVVPADKGDLDKLCIEVEILRQQLQALQRQVDNTNVTYGPFNQPISPWYKPNEPCRSPSPYWLTGIDNVRYSGVAQAVTNEEK